MEFHNDLLLSYAVSLFNGDISMKLVTNIHVSGHC